jgi:hypothetical protein
MSGPIIKQIILLLFPCVRVLAMEGACDKMDTSSPDDYIPQLIEVRKEFEGLKARFPFLRYAPARSKSRWRLHGISSLNLDVNFEFHFIEVTDLHLRGSNAATLNAYLGNADPVISPYRGRALTPCWELKVSELVMQSAVGDVSPESVALKLVRIMSIQAPDGEESNEAIASRPTRIARLPDPDNDPTFEDAMRFD